MSKYLELWNTSFDDSINEKTKPENKPYVGYSLIEGKVVYTVVPKPVTGPADNEIWYTTTDGEFVTWNDPGYAIDYNFFPINNSVTHKYENDVIISTFISNGNYPIEIGTMIMGEPVSSPDKERLVTLHIPSTFLIGTDAFGYCSNLKNVTLDGPCGIFIVDNLGQSYFSDCTSLESFTIPLNSTAIPYACFWNCSSLTSVVIPESVTRIKSDAFNNTGIYNDGSNWENDVLYIDNYLIRARESISGAYTIKENTRLIADSAFENCSSLTSVVIPDGVTGLIGTFSGCTALTSVVIPDSVTDIGGAFYECTSLTSITFDGTVEQWNNINKGSAWNLYVPATYVQCSDGQVVL